MRKVYILVDGGHDYSDATRFGELVFLNIPLTAKWDFSRVYLELKEGLSEAKEDDLFLLSHLTSQCCIATAILTEWFGRVNYLIYRPDKKWYEEKNLVLNNEVFDD